MSRAAQRRDVGRAAHRPTMNIGEVLAQLSMDFPDVTLSKIRFLESEGLVEPERTAAGYRQFTHEDVDRLRYVLGAQRDNYLPLRVIREHLEAMDRGLEPPPLPGAAPRVPRVVPQSGLPGPERFARRGRTLRLSRSEIMQAAGIDDALLTALQTYQLLVAGPDGHFDEDALVIARSVGQLAAFGIEPRHLRAFRTAADREIGLVEQVTTPLRRHRGADAAGRAEEAAREISALCVRLHAALVASGLRAAGP